MSGPVEDGPWAETITARVVEPGPSPRVHGYDVQRDLAVHYGLADLGWLAVQGELPPDEAHRAAFEAVLAFLAPVPVSEGPAHAGALARTMATHPSGVAGIVAVTLAEQVRHALAAHESLWPWLRGEADAPPSALVRGEAEPGVERLQALLSTHGVEPRVFEVPTSLRTALLGCLWHLGFRSPEALTAVWQWARLPCALAESFAARPGRLVEYPMNVPAFRYEGADEEEPA